ncbi:SYQ [Enterospora canceri]|uniref:glutamine--tRNA ligase n=1 Tax=Enterospora canceri TaxID=1081671 RepID=A0A1Y1S6I1_9MICR|nr:SYQ [Enterospora canceri]
MTLAEKLQGISISKEKIEEIDSKPALKKNIESVIASGNTFTKMQYSLACTAPKGTDLKTISDVIETGVVKNDSLLKGVYELKNKTKEEIIEWCKGHTYDENEIRSFIRRLKEKEMSKVDIKRELKKKYPRFDTRIFLDEIKEYGTDLPLRKYEKSWLDEGLVATLHQAGENKQANEEIMKAHLKRTEGKVVTRFPPEPNGCLHIGHAKALNLSFEYANKYDGITYLRFDDTNPKNEADELYDGIIEDVKWLGFKPYKITASSDHFEAMFDMCRKLIQKDRGYVCFCTVDDIRTRRQNYQAERDAGNADPTILSPYRNCSIEENAMNFEKMLRGQFRDGEAVFRFKMPLDSKNPLMLDLIGARIIDMVHDRKKRNYIVYPSYEFALCVCDSLEDVTHSFCSREFYTRQEPYHWLLQELEMYEPVQWEFSRLNVSNTVLSKRKLSKIVEQGVGWDDPRLFTIKGMRRRGFPAAAINEFTQSVGITFSETIVDVKILESFVARKLFATAPRAFCLIDPLKVHINKRVKGTIAGEEYDVNKVVYISRDDFKESEDEDFHRLTPTNPMGLVNLGVLKYTGKESDGIRCELLPIEELKPKKFVQWLPDLSNKVELRMYGPLFKSFNPIDAGFMKDADLDGSLRVVDGFVDNSVMKSHVEDKFQFIRIGYFCVDPDSVMKPKETKIVLNLTLELNKSH